MGLWEVRFKVSNESNIKLKSIKKTIDVLNCFVDKQPLGVTEISDKLGLYKSNVHNILSTLTAMDYLDQDKDTGKYYIGIGIVRLAHAMASRYTFHKVASVHLQQISDQAGETVYLTVAMKRMVYYLDAAIPSASNYLLSGTLRYSTEPLHCTGSGKAMLAFMSPEDREEYLSQPLVAMTPNTITDLERFREELRLTRERGYALDNMESEIGTRCVAVPIKNANGLPVGAMSISGPAYRFADEEKTSQHVALLKRHVRQIEYSI